MLSPQSSTRRDGESLLFKAVQPNDSLVIITSSRQSLKKPQQSESQIYEQTVPPGNRILNPVINISAAMSIEMAEMLVCIFIIKDSPFISGKRKYGDFSRKF